MKVSWLLLTYNRNDVVKDCLTHNIDNAGAEWDEFIQVDNASEIENDLGADIYVRNSTNRGVAFGYNAGLLLARGDWVILMDSDMKMPKDWLKTLIEHAKAIPETGCISSYCMPVSQASERIRGPEYVLNGKTIQPCMPMGRVFFRRDLLADAGFCHEGFGLFGWEHVCWGFTLERALMKRNLLTYTIPGFQSEHQYQPAEEWKQREVDDPKKEALKHDLWLKGWPACFPW